MSSDSNEKIRELEANSAALIRTLSGVQVQHPFFVPIVAHRWEDCETLNARLEDAITRQQQISKGIDRSNVGGWHSEPGLLEWAGDPAVPLIARMVALANHSTRLLFQEHGVKGPKFGWKISAWANVNRAGDWNKMHFHSGATWSGTYYVRAGDPPPPEQPRAGYLAFLDPLLAAQMSFFPGILPQYREFGPKPGLMILFPSYLQHVVQPYMGQEPRISIAFNLSKDPYP